MPFHVSVPSTQPFGACQQAEEAQTLRQTRYRNTWRQSCRRIRVIPDSWGEGNDMDDTAHRDAGKTVRECRASIERADYLDIRHVAKDIPESRRSQYAACRCLPLTEQRETVPAIAAAEASEERGMRHCIGSRLTMLSIALWSVTPMALNIWQYWSGNAIAIRRNSS